MVSLPPIRKLCLPPIVGFVSCHRLCDYVLSTTDSDTTSSFFSPRSSSDPISKWTKLLGLIPSSSSPPGVISPVSDYVSDWFSVSVCGRLCTHGNESDSTAQKRRGVWQESKQKSPKITAMRWECFSRFVGKMCVSARPRSRILWGCLLNVCFTACSYEFRGFIYPLPVFHALPHIHIQRILDMETTVSLSCLKSCFSSFSLWVPCWWINCGKEGEDFLFLDRV